MFKREENNVTIFGYINSGLVVDHKIAGETFFCFYINCVRSSGIVDTIPCLISNRTVNIDEFETAINDFNVIVNGEWRTHRINKKISNEDGTYYFKNSTNFYIMVDSVDLVSKDESKDDLNAMSYINSINLIGEIVGTPSHRFTPNGREICDITIKIPRSYNKIDFIPCIIWGRNSRYAASLTEGTLIKITGRLQSREYNKPIKFESCEDGNIKPVQFEKRIAYDASVSTIEVIENTTEE